MCFPGRTRTATGRAPSPCPTPTRGPPSQERQGSCSLCMFSSCPTLGGNLPDLKAMRGMGGFGGENGGSLLGLLPYRGSMGKCRCLPAWSQSWPCRPVRSEMVIGVGHRQHKETFPFTLSTQPRLYIGAAGVPGLWAQYSRIPFVPLPSQD